MAESAVLWETQKDQMTEPDLAAAAQLVQLSSEDNEEREEEEEEEEEEERHKPVTSSSSAAVAKGVGSKPPVQVEEVLSRRKKRFASIAYIYRKTKPIEVMKNCSKRKGR